LINAIGQGFRLIYFSTYLLIVEKTHAVILNVTSDTIFS